MKKDIFTKDSRIKEMIEKLSGIPCAKSMLKDIPMDLLEMLSSLFSDLEISVKNDVVAEIRIKRNGEEDWNYYIAEQKIVQVVKFSIINVIIKDPLFAYIKMKKEISLVDMPLYHGQVMEIVILLLNLLYSL